MAEFWSTSSCKGSDMGFSFGTLEGRSKDPPRSQDSF